MDGSLHLDVFHVCVHVSCCHLIIISWFDSEHGICFCSLCSFFVNCDVFGNLRFGWEVALSSCCCGFRRMLFCCFSGLLRCAVLEFAFGAITVTVTEITTGNIRSFDALNQTFVGRLFFRRASYDRKRRRTFILWLGLLFLFVFKLFMLLPRLLFELL